MKKALIFDPYFDTLGGGERYCLTFALGLIDQGYTVELAWPDRQTLTAAEDRFGLDFSQIKLNKTAHSLFKGRSSLLKRFLFTTKYSLVFWFSDGSLPFLFSKNNLVHFQVPFKNISGNRLINFFKTIFIHKFVYNSQFTATVHETHFPKNKSIILYPPIDVKSLNVGKKEKIILSVGRFDSPDHPKRQDILIDAFRELNKTYPDYQLLMAGGNQEDTSILDSLKEKAIGLPVKIIVNPDFIKLKSLYTKAKFFWHAAGFEIDEKTNPEMVEHFGMTTVEGMASGCVPIVIAKGGQKEIVVDGTGYLCTNASEIAAKTKLLIKDDYLYQKTQKEGLARVNLFSNDSFFSRQKKIL